MPGIRKYRRDTSEVSCCLKYVIFGVNVLFWFLGLIVLAVGVWAWTEKDTFNNLSRLTNIALDPAFILICVGAITFIIGFTGCVGALRENTCLLACQLSERVIHERGCLAAGEDWLQRHFPHVAAILLGPLALKNYDRTKIIYDKGCLEAAEEWFDHNLLIVATSAVCTAFAQILGICFAQNLRADIFAQKAKWH
ncbi:hypothetical protein HF086_010890 [Spodoptera exigua]|uniref:Tetraspanin n=1 Tax=Spodoptera exigua TaxID=7107 RepID=A0A922MJB0_SPOEX|nr:hypothetical protein HF086_010890 [Spodoptera exigua]